jgi:hypothetical protein
MKWGSKSLGWLLAWGLGCSVGDSSNNSSGLGPGPWQLPGSSGDQGSGPATGGSTMDAADGSESTAGPPPGGSSGDPSTSSPGSSDGEPADTQGTFGGADDNGMQPESGWWAHCIPNSIACDAGFACLTTDAGNDGVCTAQCNPPGDPGSCGASPGGTAEPVCLSVGGDSVCALGCEGGLTCPGGMICINESDDAGPISICI